MVENKHKIEKLTNKSSDIFLSKAGYEVRLSDSVWILDKDVSVYILLSMDEETYISYLKTMKFYAQNYSSHHVSNVNDRFKYYLKSFGVNSISTISLINFRSTLTRETEWYLGSIKGFLKKWHELGYEGVSDDVVELLNSWKIKGNIKGDVVKRLDPEKGPLSDIELIAFNEGAVQSYEQNLITLDELSMSLVSSATGRRAIQISHLKIKDILQGLNKKGEPVYILNIPRAKQRAAFFRSEFKQLQITEELWKIINAQVSAVVKFFNCKYLPDKLNSSEIAELPLFPSYKDILSINSDKSELQGLLVLDVLHIQSKAITDSVKKVVRTANVYSERTGELLKISSNRFRYTVGTRAAREGFGSLIIAELLDHTDTQNANVYVENIPEYAARINEKIGHLMAPYARAFLGVLVDSEGSA